MDVVAWLRSLGLEQYEAVTAVGHRRKLLEAIAELRSAKTEPPPSEAFSPAPTAQSKDAFRENGVGETVLPKLTAEDVKDLGSRAGLRGPFGLTAPLSRPSAYQKCVAETVQRFGGFVAKYMGDGVLVYFGYPQAHEDDAERAVRAGLELVAAVSVLNSSVPLQTRVGIATGWSSLVI
jgi:hypothetical protein